MNVLFLISGLAILLWGAHFLLTSISSPQRTYKPSSNIAGVLITACIASVPELAISVRAIVQNEPPQLAMGLGVLAGACIANLGMALAIWALRMRIKPPASLSESHRAYQHGAAPDQPAALPSSRWGNAFVATVGGIMVWVGSDLTLDGAVGFASAKEIAPTLVGLTLVSVILAGPKLLRNVAAAGQADRTKLVLTYYGSLVLNMLFIILTVLRILK